MLNVGAPYDMSSGNFSQNFIEAGGTLEFKYSNLFISQIKEVMSRGTNNF